MCWEDVPDDVRVRGRELFEVEFSCLYLSGYTDEIHMQREDLHDWNSKARGRKSTPSTSKTCLATHEMASEVERPYLYAILPRDTVVGQDVA